MAQHNISGTKAELAVAEFLKLSGYKIVDQNWKTKWCEIDIVAKKDNVIHFVEVKYRSNSSQGGGFDYIHNKKLLQMRRAAESWALIHKWNGEYVLGAAEVSGDDLKIDFIAEV